jgi:hypothetical protein
VIVQSCTVSLEVVPGTCSETSTRSSDDSHAVIGIKVEEDTDVTIKVEEIPEPISFLPQFQPVVLVKQCLHYPTRAVK